MKKIALSLAVAAAVIIPGTAALAGNGSPSSDSANPFTMAVFGDEPYATTPTGTEQFDATPAFIQSINNDPKVGLVMHIGDIHSGQQYCTQPYDQSIFDLWTTFKDPLVYTPGDNEWADCHKKAEGGGEYSATPSPHIDYVNTSGTFGTTGDPVDYAGGDPVANLALIRSIFFVQPGLSLGGQPMRVISQAQAYDHQHPTDAEYVENVMWEQSQVLFVTINLPGGSNNDQDTWYKTPFQTPGQIQEGPQRTGADTRWLDAAFAKAAADGMKAVVIGAQADMWDPEKGKDHQAGYEPIVSTIASDTNNFGKPVLMFNGDSHVYQSGNPYSPSDPNNFIHPGYTVPNFHRVVVHGSTAPLEWLKLTIDPKANIQPGASDTAFGPFTWEREITSLP